MGARKVLSSRPRAVAALAGVLVMVMAVTAGLAGPATPASAVAPGWTIRTVAGGPGGPGLASTVSIGAPCGLTWSGSTLLVGTEQEFFYFGGAIRAVSTTTGRLTNVAGVPIAGSAPDGSPARSAQLTQSCDAIIDHQGNVVFSDSSVADTGPRSRSGNQLIRVVAMKTGTFYGQAMRKGDLYTIGGNGKFGFSGDGGPATAAQIGTPLGLAVDAAGNIVFATAWPTGHIRVIAGRTGTFYGQAMTAGDIYTIAGGDATTPCATASTDGQAATSVQLALLTWMTHRNLQVYPNGLRIDHEGNVVFTDFGCDGQATVQVVAGGTGAFYGRPYGRTFTAGDIYTIAGGGTASPGDGGPALRASLARLGGLAIDRAGNVIVAQTSAQRVRVIAAKTGRFYGQNMTAGRIYTLAGGHGSGGSGDGSPAGRARLDFPSAVAVDGHGNVAIADTGNERVRLVAATSGTFYGQQMHAGDIYTIAGNGVPSFSGDGGPAPAARFGIDNGTELSTSADHGGDLLIGDQRNGRIRFVPAKAGTYFGRHMAGGDIYTLGGSTPAGFGYDCPADAGIVQARALEPCYVAFDQAGNAVLTTPHTVKVIAVRTGRFYGQAMSAGHAYLLGGGGKSIANGVLASTALLRPVGLAVDSHGNILTGSRNRLRVIAVTAGTFYGVPMRAGRVYTIGASVELLGADRSGNALVTIGNRIEVIAGRTGTFYGLAMTAGHVYAIAGDGTAEDSGDGGPAAEAGMMPESAAVDASGNLLIGDAGLEPKFGFDPVIRVVAEHTGTFYGQSMIAGDIYTIAGGGTSFADGVAPLDARFLSTPTVIGWPGGGVLESDNELGQIRLISQAG